MRKDVKYLASLMLVALSLLTPQASFGMDAPTQGAATQGGVSPK